MTKEKVYTLLPTFNVYDEQQNRTTSYSFPLHQYLIYTNKWKLQYEKHGWYKSYLTYKLIGYLESYLIRRKSHGWEVDAVLRRLINFDVHGCDLGKENTKAQVLPNHALSYILIYIKAAK